MIYKVRFTKQSLKTLEKLDKPTAALILGWIKKNLENTSNPFIHGKALLGDLKGSWRYRIGDYRLICHIVNEELIILVLRIGHRKDIYDL